jgi:hypothetical protein
LEYFSNIRREHHHRLRRRGGASASGVSLCSGGTTSPGFKGCLSYGRQVEVFPLGHLANVVQQTLLLLQHTVPVAQQNLLLPVPQQG